MEYVFNALHQLQRVVKMHAKKQDFIHKLLLKEVSQPILVLLVDKILKVVLMIKLLPHVIVDFI